jgi:hypothetical protein
VVEALWSSRALWNRGTLDLGSDETLAQLLDRGEIEAWRELFYLAGLDVALRARLHRLVRSVPVSFPYFWLAALAALGEEVDFSAPLPAYPLAATL